MNINADELEEQYKLKDMEKELKPVDNIYTTTVEYKIGNIYVRLKSQFDLAAMSLYTPFIVDTISVIPNITIEIKQISVFLY